MGMGMHTKLWVLWVHGDAQLTNSLTKGHEPGQLRLYYSSGHHWKLVYDAKYQSARTRKAAGILPFENVPHGVLRHVSSDSPGEAMHVSAGATQFPVEFPDCEATSDYSSVIECQY